MAFLTPDQMRAVRLKGSDLIKLDSLDVEIRVVRMNSTRVLEFANIKADVAAGKKTQGDVLRYMVEHGCTDFAGTPLTPDDVTALFDVLPLDDITTLVQAVNTHMQGATVKVTAKAGEAVVEAIAEELPPSEKKDVAS